MSKLNIFRLLIGAALTAVLCIVIAGAHTPLSRSRHNSTETHTLESGKNIWGKSRGPILVRIDEIDKTKTTVTLKGLVRSQLENIQIEWKLPQGAALLQGLMSQTLSNVTEEDSRDIQVQIDMSSAVDDLVVFTAYVEKEGERVGHSRVYKWNKHKKEKEHVEKIKLKMKQRNSTFIR